MMDLRTHAWAPSAAAGVTGDDDVKMLLADLESGGGGGGGAGDASDVDSHHEQRELALSLEADASTMVMMMLLPGVNGMNGGGGEAATAPATPAGMASASLSEEEQQRELAGDAQESPDFNDDDDFDEELWTAAAHDEPFDLIDADEEPLALAPFGDLAASAGVGMATMAMTATAPVAGAAGDTKKRRGRKPSMKPKAAPKKAKRPPPSPSKARLRNYERRSRTKREVRLCGGRRRDARSHHLPPITRLFLPGYWWWVGGERIPRWSVDGGI